MTDVYAPPTASLDARKIDLVSCASRWRRFGAFFADLLVCLIVIGILMMFAKGSPMRALCLIPVQGLLFPLYRFCMQGRSGQTLGQRLLKICVVRTRGGAIGFGVSARRALLLTLISIPWVVSNMIILAQISSLQIKLMGMYQLNFMPIWWVFLSLLAGFICLSELAPFFFTARRQTLSDLFADTVVVNVEKGATGAHHD